MNRPLTALIGATAVALALGPALPAGAVTTAGAAPASLNGLWHTTFDGGDQYLRIDGGTYFAFVNPSDAARGSVVVSGDTITFGGSNRCSGDGTYEWSVVGTTLTLTSISTDPCPRANFLTLPWNHVSG